MSYVKRVLQPGEEITYRTGNHWIVYAPGAALAILACATLVWAMQVQSEGLRHFLQWTAGLIGLIALIWIVWEWFRWWIIEIAVTSRRVIYKKGFIWRDTNEMNLDKVESVQVKQPILGRILDYGNVTIIGTGEGRFDEIRKVAGPIRLRNCIMGK